MTGKPRGQTGPNGGICGKCSRETGSLKVHARYCKGIELQTTFKVSRGRDRALPVPVVGGPYHGTIARLGRGPRPWYLDAEGRPIVKSEGDRLMRGRPTDRVGIYVVRHTLEGDTWYAWRQIQS